MRPKSAGCGRTFRQNLLIDNTFTYENTHELAGTGICGIAVISAIYAQDHIREAAAALKKVTAEAVGAEQ